MVQTNSLTIGKDITWRLIRMKIVKKRKRLKSMSVVKKV